MNKGLPVCRCLKRMRLAVCITHGAAARIFLFFVSMHVPKIASDMRGSQLLLVKLAVNFTNINWVDTKRQGLLLIKNLLNLYVLMGLHKFRI